MKTRKELIESIIKNEIKDNSKMVQYCVAKAFKLPYPGYLHPVMLAFLIFLSAQVSHLFYVLVIAFVAYWIIIMIYLFKKYIVVFLENNIKLIEVKGDSLNIVNIHSYSYNDVKSVSTRYKKELTITLQERKEFTLFSNLKSENSSFNLKDFNVEKYCMEKKTAK